MYIKEQPISTKSLEAAPCAPHHNAAGKLCTFNSRKNITASSALATSPGVIVLFL